MTSAATPRTHQVDDLVHERALSLPLDALADERVEATVARLVRELAPLLSAGQRRQVTTRVVERLRGLGPIQSLLDLDGVTEIIVNGPGPVWIEHRGHLRQTEIHLGADELSRLVERLVAPLGRRLDRTSPLVEGRLPDGSRIHVAVAPVAVAGPHVTIRRFQRTRVELGDWCEQPLGDLLAWAVGARANIIVSGGTSSGKTTLLNSLVDLVPESERLVTIEDAPELDLRTPNGARLQARPPAVDGPPAVTVRDLVRTALRMRPDRIIVGEVRGVEVIDMLQAMNTGHEGSVSTVHANSPVDALLRLETMVLLADALPPVAVRSQLQRAVDLIVHLGRDRSGRRHVLAVAEPVAEGALRVRTLADARGLHCLPQRPPRRPVELPASVRSR